MDLSNHVILPRDEYVELQTAAWDQTPTTVKDRISGTVQTTLIFAGFAAAVTGASYGWAKAVDWLETRRLERETKKP